MKYKAVKLTYSDDWIVVIDGGPECVPVLHDEAFAKEIALALNRNELWEEMERFLRDIVEDAELITDSAEKQCRNLLAKIDALKEGG
jgi:hypothetical protein